MFLRHPLPPFVGPAAHVKSTPTPCSCGSPPRSACISGSVPFSTQGLLSLFSVPKLPNGAGGGYHLMLIRPHKFLLLNLCFQGCLVVSSVQQTYTHSMWIELSFFKILPQLGDTAPKISHLSFSFCLSLSFLLPLRYNQSLRFCLRLSSSFPKLISPTPLTLTSLFKKQCSNLLSPATTCAEA